MALGATAEHVKVVLVGQALGPVAAGLTLGAVGAVAVARVLGTLLYGMDPVDPLTFATVGELLLTVVLLATSLPGPSSEPDGPDPGPANRVGPS